MAQHVITSPLHVDGSDTDPITVQVHQGEVSYQTRSGKTNKIKDGDPSVVIKYATDLVPAHKASVYLT
jgi:hypothetical protein